ncbi:hypothetical protein AAA799D11_01077, partial [Marine Group I thaumarchaeote SCGC AAA799-D11]
MKIPLGILLPENQADKKNILNASA